MLFRSLLFLAIATPLVLGAPTDGKDKDLSSVAIFASPIASFNQTPSADESSKDRFMKVSSLIGNDKAKSASGKDKTSSTSVIFTAIDTSIPFVAKDDKPAIVPSKDDKTTSVSVSVKDKNTSTSAILTSSDVSTSLVTKDVKSTTLPLKDKTTGPPLIVYSVTIPAGAAMNAHPNGTVTQPSAHTVYLTSPSPTLIFLGSVSKPEFPGYEIVPSTAKLPSKDSHSDTESSIIPVYTPAMLGNAYGGGFVATPSVYVTKRPFPNGPSEGVPPGYGTHTKQEIAPSLSPLQSMVINKDKTITVGILTAVKPPKDQSSKFETATLASSLPSNISTETKKPEVPLMLVSAFTSGALAIETGISGKIVPATDKKAHSETKSVAVNSTENGPAVYYTTETFLKTTTYCPVSTVSGKETTFSSTTLTETLVTINVAPVTKSAATTAGVEYVPSLVASTSSQTTNGTGKLPLVPSQQASPSNAPFLNSTLVIGPKTEQFSISPETMNAKTEFASTATVMSSNGRTQVRSGPATATSSPLKSIENLSGASIVGSEMKGSKTASENQGTFNSNSAAQFVPSRGSAETRTPTESAIPASLMSESSSLLGYTGATTPARLPLPTLMVSEISSLFGSSGASTPTIFTIPTSLISQLSSPFGSLEASTPSKPTVSPSLVSEESYSFRTSAASTSTKPPILGPLLSELFSPSTGSGASIQTKPVIPASLVLQSSSLFAGSGVSTLTKPTIPASLISELSSLLASSMVSAAPNASIFPILTPAASIVSSESGLETAARVSIAVSGSLSIIEVSSLSGTVSTLGTPTFESILPGSIIQTANVGNSARTLVSVAAVSASVGGTEILLATKGSLTSGSLLPETAPPAGSAVPFGAGTSSLASATSSFGIVSSAEGFGGTLHASLNGSTAPSLLTGLRSLTTLSETFPAPVMTTTLEASSPGIPSEVSETTAALQPIPGSIGSAPVTASNGTTENIRMAESTVATAGNLSAPSSNKVSEKAASSDSIIAISGSTQAVVSGGASESTGVPQSAIGFSGGIQAVPSGAAPESTESPESAVGASGSAQVTTSNGLPASAGASAPATEASFGVQEAASAVDSTPIVNLNESTTSFGLESTAKAPISQTGISGTSTSATSPAVSVGGGALGSLAGTLSRTTPAESSGESPAASPAESKGAGALTSPAGTPSIFGPVESSGASRAASPPAPNKAGTLGPLAGSPPGPTPMASTAASETATGPAPTAETLPGASPAASPAAPNRVGTLGPLAGTPSGPTTETSPEAPEGAGTSISTPGTPPISVPAESYEVSAAGDISPSPAISTSPATLENSTTATMEGASASTSAVGSPVSIAQGGSHAGPVLSTGTQANLSTGITTSGSKGGNNSVSVILSPTAVLPFHGAGVKLSVRVPLGLSGLLAISFFA